MSSSAIVDSPSSGEDADAVLLAHLFDSAQEDQFAVNTRAAYQAETISEIVAFAKAHPHVYAHTEHVDAVEIAERAVVRDAALRFQMSENAIRTLANVAGTADARLPGLWRRAKDGYATIRQVETAVILLAVLGEHPDITREFDDELSDAVVRLGAGGFAARARRTARRLSQIPPEIRHRDAAARRRVVVDPADDGMAWLSAYLPLNEAVAAKRRLTSSAKHVATTERGGRTRDQIRADLLSAWLRGENTPTAVKTKVLVTIPVNLLTPDAQASVRRAGPTRQSSATGRNLNDEPLLDGREPIDPATAIGALLYEGVFRRVITDPVTGTVVDMDRRARIATPAQREWLTLAYATCAVDGCEHPAADSDIDHWLDYHGPYAGRTNLGNLNPFCGNDHVLKTRSKLRFVRGPDGTVRIQSPVLTRGTSMSEDDWSAAGDDAVDRSALGEDDVDWNAPRDGGVDWSSEDLDHRTWAPRGAGDVSPEDQDEVRRLTSALARLEKRDYGDNPPF
ncbi:DUF222 domain-containing protein [Microbacterium candidum]|uniref:DUF222 domain-containing protein n=1 Tax=Microbacterium candidum TaxID=3041922 RepID=A0ABT7N1N9_9MICO|nr:DUF222 domain-containing protein [Microbacterium sp. ASV49]MDL9980628.1 DUF222 domain-containing protein [Microbacterium sp. ASV49]